MTHVYLSSIDDGDIPDVDLASAVEVVCYCPVLTKKEYVGLCMLNISILI